MNLGFRGFDVTYEYLGNPVFDPLHYPPIVNKDALNTQVF